MINKQENGGDVNDIESDGGQFAFETVQNWKVVDYKNGAAVWLADAGEYVKFDKNN